MLKLFITGGCLWLRYGVKRIGVRGIVVGVGVRGRQHAQRRPVRTGGCVLACKDLAERRVKSAASGSRDLTVTV